MGTRCELGLAGSCLAVTRHRAAELRGLVTDGLGVPIAGAHVSVQGPADPARPIVLTSGSKETDSGGGLLVAGDPGRG